VPSIAFICTANVCRSMMAHAICTAEVARRGLRITVISAGLADFEGTLVADNARVTCQKHQTWLPKFAATYIRNVDLDGVTRAFVMEKRHVDLLLRQSSLTRDQISLLGEFDPQQRGGEIRDPMGEDIVAFESCYERLRDCVVHYLDTLRNDLAI
jgi:protein-tyrosine phosphatase